MAEATAQAMAKRRSDSTEAEFKARRLSMVAEQLEQRDIDDPDVLAAMRTVPRHLFVPERRNRDTAYSDGPQVIGYGQTISQPYVVASMTQLLELKPSDRILEIGTGCGYQAAVLAEIVKQVYTVEIIPELVRRARQTLKDLGYRNVTVVDDDGSFGYPKAAPYDGILVTAAAPKMPEELVRQLKIGRHMVLPMATDKWGRQFLYKITRTETGTESERLYEVRFVPMVGDIEGRDFSF